MRVLLAFSILILPLFCNNDDFEPADILEQKIILLLPEDNEICLGSRISDNKIRVDFDWEDIEDGTSYSLEYEDSLTGQLNSVTTSESSASIELEPGTPYIWRVIVFESNGSSRSSEEFSFYTEGLAEGNHVPFPAEISIDDNGGGNITVNWIGSDIDGDIDYFSIYFSDTNPPTEVLPVTRDASFSTQIENGKMYYLRVITVDLNSNFSESRRTIQF